MPPDAGGRALRVRDAGPGEMEAILRHSHAVWGAGASLDDYIAFNRAQRDSPWGRENYRFLVAEAGGALVAAMKLYSFPGTLDGRDLRVAGVGAVFTVPEARGRGHAAVLLEIALGSAYAAGHAVALLMSEIGADYYARLGFTALPAQEAGCLPFLPVPWAGEPGWLAAGGTPESHLPGLRPATAGDLDALAAIRDASTRGQRFRLRRDRSGWEQTLLRADRWRRIAGDDARGADRVEVIERDGRVESYCAWCCAPGAVEWREHGALPGAEERLIDLFWTVIARARARGVNRVDAMQFPEIVIGRRLYPIAVRPLRDPAIMMRVLDPALPAPAFATPEECRLSWLDQY